MVRLWVKLDHGARQETLFIATIKNKSKTTSGLFILLPTFGTFHSDVVRQLTTKVELLIVFSSGWIDKKRIKYIT